MPTWCYNRLQIVGRHNEIDRCLQAIKGNDSAFDFNTLIPYPGDQEAARNPAYPSLMIPDLDDESRRAWCARLWRSRHWGTKWNAQPLGFDDHPIVAQRISGGAEIVFHTAFGPPLPVLLELSRRFPKLDVRLSFGGPEMYLEGLARFKKGVMVFYDEVACNSDLQIPQRDWEELLDRAGPGMRRIGAFRYPARILRMLNGSRRSRSRAHLQKDSSVDSISEDVPF
jgi:hypothetical protein